ncbi:MAG: type II secretion system F family protein [Acidimicrobiia bacterium]
MSAAQFAAVLAVATCSALMMRLVMPPAPRLARRVLPYVLGTRMRLGSGADTSTARRLLDIQDHGGLRNLVAPAVGPVIERLGHLIERRGDTELRRHFRQAGLRDLSTEQFRSQQVIGALAGMMTGALLGIVLQRSGLVPLFAVLGAVIGASRPRGRIDHARDERMEYARIEIYTVNQLVAMQLRTGAAPVTAVSRVVERGNGVVIEDLREILGWIRHGLGEGDAFRKGAELAAEPSVARTLNLLAVGTERGTDLGGSLLEFSRDLQDERAENIRRTATRKRAAMLIPTIAILAPVMLLFLAAPLPSIVLHGR